MFDALGELFSMFGGFDSDDLLEMFDDFFEMFGLDLIPDEDPYTQPMETTQAEINELTDPDESDEIDMMEPSASQVSQLNHIREEIYINSEVETLDLDGDGVEETMLFEFDEDGDGVSDGTWMTSFVDTDLDGEFDQWIEQVDFGSDGTVDLINILEDLDGDGEFDYFEQIIGADTDGDGILDTVVSMVDHDMDDIVDEVFETPVFEADGTDESDFSEYDATYENFDPDDYDPNVVVGNPVDNMENWHMQQDGGSCAVVSQEFILEYISGQEFDEAELCELAHEMGWFEYGSSGGTSPFDIGNILVLHGLTVEQSFDNNAEDLHGALASGGSVIVVVDADEFWEGEDDDFTPGDGANHAIQVIGIDYSNPDEPMVIINDSGHPDGCGAMVSLDLFMDAWEDSGCFMVVAHE